MPHEPRNGVIGHSLKSVHLIHSTPYTHLCMKRGDLAFILMFNPHYHPMIVSNTVYCTAHDGGNTPPPLFSTISFRARSTILKLLPPSFPVGCSLTPISANEDYQLDSGAPAPTDPLLSMPLKSPSAWTLPTSPNSLTPFLGFNPTNFSRRRPHEAVKKPSSWTNKPSRCHNIPISPASLGISLTATFTLQ